VAEDTGIEPDPLKSVPLSKRPGSPSPFIFLN